MPSYKYETDCERVRSETPELFEGGFDPDQLVDRGLDIAAKQFVVKGATDEVARKVLLTLFSPDDSDADLRRATGLPYRTDLVKANIDTALMKARRS